MKLTSTRKVLMLSVAIWSTPLSAYAADSLQVQFSWSATKACSTTPPAFRLANVPKGTKYLSFRLIDYNAAFNHGGGEVVYKGSNAIPADAFGGDYQGPCPPIGQTHTYEWTVDALDANKNVLAEGKATGQFPMK